MYITFSFLIGYSVIVFTCEESEKHEHTIVFAPYRVTTFAYEDTRLAERRRRDAFNHGFLLTSLELMVNLFRYIDATSSPRHTQSL